jgi:lipoyl(octanoyl) transferase
LKNIILIETGLSEYREVWDLQKKLFNRINRQGNLNYLIISEHKPIITIGKSGTKAHLLAKPASLKKKNIEVVKVDRGGDITFHGPGQIVGYPIMNLTNFKMDIGWYLRSIEQVIMETLTDIGISAHRIKGLTGIWIGNKKICAIGVKITRWVSMHGFALNVSTDLNYFQYIVPCGIKNGGVTSISEIVGNIIAPKDVTRYLIKNFEKIFEVRIVSQKPVTFT